MDAESERALDALFEDVMVEMAEQHQDQKQNRAKKEPLFTSVYQFVSEYLVHAYARRVTQNNRWCAEWFKHTEALARLQALWLAYEDLRYKGPLGQSVWWNQHLDPCMAELMDPDKGPFSKCDPEKDRHTPDLPLPTKQIAEGLEDPTMDRPNPSTDLAPITDVLEVVQTPSPYRDGDSEFAE
ncbi:DUF4913 domain-containing protein [Paeniglutamicibacter sp. NPDC091659]|uniref:DUF4913 domain-containing protein n=1 Tax=Paeniglutamicibacter sp. NPDC091659 TaxID=3364389 RepID=UPI003805C44A